MGAGVIHEQIPSVDAALIEAIAAFGVSDVHEALGAERGIEALMRPEMRALNPRLHIVGQAITADDAPGNNLMMHSALALAGTGHVLVLTSGGGARGALWGELAARFAQRRGIAGVIVDGNIRDTAALTDMGFPVWATAISPLRSDKREGGSVNVPVSCAGVTVHPGDVIVADADGVIAVRPDELPAMIKAAGRRKVREAMFRERIDAGDTLFDLMGLQGALDAAGVRRA